MTCDVIPYGTRSTYDMNVHVPPFRTDYGKKTFFCMGGQIWNSLRNIVKESSNLNSFKRNFKNQKFR